MDRDFTKNKKNMKKNMDWLDEGEIGSSVFGEEVSKKEPPLPEFALKDIERQKRHAQRSKKVRSRRAGQIKRTRNQAIVTFLMIVFLSFSLVKIINVRFWYLPSGIFKSYPNRYIEIEGNRLLNSNDIMVELKDVTLPKKPLYLVKTRVIEDRLRDNPFIRDIYARRFWLPARIVIFVRERKPVLSVARSCETTPVAIVTSDLKIIEGKNLFPKALEGNYVILTNQNYRAWSPLHMEYLIYLADLVKKYSKSELKYIDMRDPDDVYIHLDKYVLRVGELNKTAFSRIKRISSIIPQLEKINKNVDYIDLRWDKSTFIKVDNNTSPTPETKEKNTP